MMYLTTVLSISSIILSIYTFKKTEKNKKEIQKQIKINDIIIDEKFREYLYKFSLYNKGWDQKQIIKDLTDFKKNYIEPYIIINKDKYSKIEEEVDEQIEKISKKNLTIDQQSKALLEVSNVINRILDF